MYPFVKTAQESHTQALLKLICPLTVFAGPTCVCLCMHPVQSESKARLHRDSLCMLLPASSAASPHPSLCLQLDSKCNILNDQMFRSNSSAEYIARASKVVTLVDLAGHERYFKTTAYGLTGHMPDYACLIVGANAGWSHPHPDHCLSLTLAQTQTPAQCLSLLPCLLLGSICLLPSVSCPCFPVMIHSPPTWLTGGGDLVKEHVVCCLARVLCVGFLGICP